MITIRSITNKDTDWVKQVFQSINLEWVEGLDGFIAEDTRPVGLITYKIQSAICEIISLNSLTPGKGIGTMLFEKVLLLAKDKRCKKIITKVNNYTKDFFQKKGFTNSGAFQELLL